MCFPSRPLEPHLNMGEDCHFSWFGGFVQFRMCFWGQPLLGGMSVFPRKGLMLFFLRVQVPKQKGIYLPETTVPIPIIESLRATYLGAFDPDAKITNRLFGMRGLGLCGKLPRGSIQVHGRCQGLCRDHVGSFCKGHYRLYVRGSQNALCRLDLEGVCNNIVLGPVYLLYYNMMVPAPFG